MEIIGYGVVGSGYFGAELARIMNTKPGAAVRAVYDPDNGKRAAEELGCGAEESLEALVSRKDIQAVIGDILYCHGARNAWEDTGASETWKKTRSKSGGHLYHHIHELDCVQFLMGGCPDTVTMAGGNAAHKEEVYGDEEDMLFITMEYPGSRYALLEYGSAFRWQEHYLLVQGTKGAIKLDMCNCGMTLKAGNREEHFPVHRTEEEDEDRTRIYRETEKDNGSQFGRPGRKPFLWLQGIMNEEMEFFNEVLHGAEAAEEFMPLLTGEAARNSIATADACTRSLNENRKVRLSEIIER